MTDQETKSSWTWTERREIVSEYRHSGLSQRAFCQQWGIGPSTLRNWCRRVNEDEQAAEPSSARTRFLPVRTDAEESGISASGIRLVARHGLRIEVHRDFDAATLQRLLAAVEGVA